MSHSQYPGQQRPSAYQGNYAGRGREQPGADPYGRPTGSMSGSSANGGYQSQPAHYPSTSAPYQQQQYSQPQHYYGQQGQGHYPPQPSQHQQPYQAAAYPPQGHHIQQAYPQQYSSYPQSSYSQPSGYQNAYAGPSGSQAAGPPRGRDTRRPNKPPAPPCQTAILIGLPSHVDDDGLRAFLEDMGAQVDSTTIIKDRATGLSKGFGFARFVSVEHARAFVDPNFPSITWRERGVDPDQYSDIRIKIDYSQTEKLPGERPEPRRYDNEQAPPRDNEVNDGYRDSASPPNKCLLLRYLDALTSESQIVSSLNRHFDQAGKSGGIRRVLLIKDRTSKSSWGFAFLEFVNTNAAVLALQSLLDPSVNAKGFKIGTAKPVATFAAAEAFRPAYSPSEWTFKSLEGTGDMHYRDTNAYASIANVPSDAPAGLPVQVRTKEEDEAFLAQIEKEKASTDRKKREGGLIPDAGMISVDLRAGDKRKAAEPIAAKKNSAFIQQWDKRKDEVEPPSTYSAPADEFPYGDVNKFQCLLCQRQFKSLDELRRHNDKSDLHKTNLGDKRKRDTAAEKKAQAGPAAAKATAVETIDDPSSLQYRDRAAERRQILGQPDHPVLENDSRKKRSRYEPGPSAPAPVVQPNKEGIAEDNIGHKLLKAAGWKKGSETLAADPITVKMFAAGAGIGADKGQVVGQGNTTDYRSNQFGRDKARSRYNEG